MYRQTNILERGWGKKSGQRVHGNQLLRAVLEQNAIGEGNAGLKIQ